MRPQVSSDETGKPASLMRRPRFGLVSRPPGGPGQPSAGITTGCPMSGAARGGDERAVATAPDRGPTGGICRRSEARLKGTENAAQWSAGRRLPPIARRKETPSQGVSGGFASRSGSDRKLPRLPALRSPRKGSEELDFGLRRTRRRSKNTGDGACQRSIACGWRAARAFGTLRALAIAGPPPPCPLSS